MAITHNFKYMPSPFRCIYLKPNQGLGNRLLTLDSAYAFAREFQYNKIYLCWVKSEGFSDESFGELFDLDQLPNNISLISDTQYNDAAKEFLNLDHLFTQDPDTLKYVVDMDINGLLKSVNAFCLN